MPTIRRLTAVALTGALGLGLALAVAPAPAAPGGHATPAPAPPPPRGPGGYAVPRPDLTVELDDATEADGLMEGRVRLSHALTADLAVTVQVLFPSADPSDLACPTIEPWGGCPWTIDLAVPAGATQAAFDIGVHADDGTEPTEVVGVAITHTHPAGLVDVGPAVEADLFDGDGRGGSGGGRGLAGPGRYQSSSRSARSAAFTA